ncbi:hypothetical protein [Paenibacillus pseudetheri]|uniref:hypothetical protein n=1 Tax=Paenibacillus pseudetheri TaxID=2897682 RepID=UPI001F2D7013|nr:hypothetical protein [Paenibacillus pseudetheri]
MVITLEQTAALLSRIQIAYPAFVNIFEEDDYGNVINAPTAQLWQQRLFANGITIEQAVQALDKHIDTSQFEPKIADIINNKPQLSIYDIQAQERQQEQLALLEYHESNEVIPMPDHIHELLERLENKRTLGGDDNLE